MPVKKMTPTELHKRQMPYTAISNRVIESITNPVALAIYAYLITKPNSWIVRRSDILNHFESLGLDRYGKAMRDLKAMGLLVDEYIHEDGRLAGRRLVLLGCPEHTDNSMSGKPIIQTIDPLSNKVSTITTTDSNKDLYPFEDFWKLYPKRKDKGAAMKAWKKLSSEDKAKAIEVLPSYQFDTRDNGKWIKNPATWLNAGSFYDEDSTAVTQTRRTF